MGYSTIHAFYPNMPKFFQEKYNFSNTEAATISSLPYLIASLSVPVFGSLLRGYSSSDQVYEVGLLVSLCSVLSTHLSYLLLPPDLTWSLPIFPIVIFGLGHALFTTLLSPTVPKLIENKQELLPMCFSIMKIVEGFAITFFTQMAGELRQQTGSYFWVQTLLIACNVIAILASYELAYRGLFSSLASRIQIIIS